MKTSVKKKLLGNVRVSKDLTLLLTIGGLYALRLPFLILLLMSICGNSLVNLEILHYINLLVPYSAVRVLSCRMVDQASG
nr:hypothetical protein [Thalassobacillus sp. C254]